MRFTIVTPVFDGMPWLPECVASVDAQRTDVEVQHIVLDGGSTDGSREWLAANTRPDRILVLEPDEGQTDALIRGLDRAEGDVLGWLNADDLLEPGALGRVSQVLETNPDAIAVTGAALLIDAGGSIIGAIMPPRDATFEGLLRNGRNPPQPATFFRAEAYRRVGGLDRSLDLAMDVDLWLRLAQAGRFVPVPDRILARFRKHPTAKTVSGPSRTAREDLAVRRRHGLSMLHPTNRALVRAGYVRPVTRRAWSLPRGVARRVVRALRRRRR